MALANTFHLDATFISSHRHILWTVSPHITRLKPQKSKQHNSFSQNNKDGQNKITSHI